MPADRYERKRKNRPILRVLWYDSIVKSRTKGVCRRMFDHLMDWDIVLARNCPHVSSIGWRHWNPKRIYKKDSFTFGILHGQQHRRTTVGHGKIRADQWSLFCS